MNEPEQLNNIRHSCAHLLAAAVMQLYPDAKRTIGPAIENGFYFDFDFGDPSTSSGQVPKEEDLPKIEAKMSEILQTWQSTEGREVSVDEAKKMYEGNEYKLELIDQFSKEGQTLTVFKNGSYEDLCKGGHSENPSRDIGAFKLTHLAGAYWRGSEKNKMLSRIYGTCFKSQKELDDYLAMLEEAKKRDHRKLGKELDLFVLSDLVGSGLPLFTPKGTVLRQKLLNFSEELQRKNGYQQVFIPHITKTELYKTSGHWDKFGDELFLVKSQETDDEFVLKPMNCPHHTQIYASRTRSYKDLPIRYMETTVQYRDEKAGELLGLSRVRAITIDDSHVFCRPDQVEEEFGRIINMLRELYTTLGMTFRARLSFRNEENKYLGDKQHWEEAQKTIEEVAKKLELEYYIAEGEAAFYGPKIDFMVKDNLGREWQCTTAQLDFVQPERFGLKYIDSDGSEKTPFMVHKALLGSIERFLSVYIEHTGGAFPTWLAPVQIKIIPIADRHIDYARGLIEQMTKDEIRVEIDDRSETMQAKIRDAQNQKVPFMLILGDKEVDAKTVSVRKRSGENVNGIPFEQFLADLKIEIATRS